MPTAWAAWSSCGRRDRTNNGRLVGQLMIERISLELTNCCPKACWFCYNGSRPGRGTEWTAGEVVEFLRDCARGGVRAVSFGGGEPLAFAGLLDVLDALKGTLFRSLTTSGLGLDAGMIRDLAAVGLEKVHVSIHFPEREDEVERVIGQVGVLAAAGIRAGVNLLVARESLDAAQAAVGRLHAAEIGNDRIIYLPMRLHGAPTPKDLAIVAGGSFQSTTCLQRCGKSPRFVSIDATKQVAWCSYTKSRRRLAALTYDGLRTALDGLGLSCCSKQEGSDD